MSARTASSAKAELLTRKELARFLHVSTDAVDKYVRDKADPLPVLRFGRRHLFDREEVLNWMRRRSQPARKRRRSRNA